MVKKVTLLLILHLALSLPLFAETQTTVTDISSHGIDLTHIHRQLKELGYPEHTWPDLERELTDLLTKIDFPRLQQEAAQVQSNPAQLKDFISKIGALIEQEGYLNFKTPHSLMKLLTNSFGQEDIFHLIETSPITFEEKERLKEGVVACSAISQLGSIILDLLNFNVQVAISPEHVFNCIPLDAQQVLFADFTWQVFEIVDINQYYKLEGKYQVLKEEYRLCPERGREIREQWLSKESSWTLKEILNSLYFYIYITDDFAATPSIYIYHGYVYLKKGDLNQAIADYNQALRINPNYAAAYCHRGYVYHKKGNLNQAIADYSQALRINPNDALVYYNRAIAYFSKGDYTRAWEDVRKAVKLWGAKLWGQLNPWG